jgi:hypothetical protein
MLGATGAPNKEPLPSVWSRLEYAQRAHNRMCRTLDSRSCRSHPIPMLPSQGIEVLSVHQVALERFDDGIHFTLRTAFIQRQFLDAIPLCRAIVIAAMSFIEELTMLLAHILAVSAAILDLHFTLHIGK